MFRRRGMYGLSKEINKVGIVMDNIISTPVAVNCNSV